MYILVQRIQTNESWRPPGRLNGGSGDGSPVKKHFKSMLKQWPDRAMSAFDAVAKLNNKVKVTSSPVAALTRGGPPKKMVPLPFTMMLSSDMAGTNVAVEHCLE